MLVAIVKVQIGHNFFFYFSDSELRTHSILRHIQNNIMDVFLILKNKFSLEFKSVDRYNQQKTII